MSTINNQSIFICPVCKEILTNEEEYFQHLKINHTINNNQIKLTEIIDLKDKISEKYPNYIINIKKDSNNYCKFIIELTTNMGMKIIQYFGNIDKEEDYDWDNCCDNENIFPDTAKDLFKTYDKILLNINHIIEKIKEKTNNIIDLQCTGYNCTTDLEDSHYDFCFKTKDSDEFIQETYTPYNQNESVFINEILKYSVIKLEGRAFIDEESYSNEFYINGINIRELMKKAVSEGIKLKLEMI